MFIQSIVSGVELLLSSIVTYLVSITRKSSRLIPQTRLKSLNMLLQGRAYL